MLNDKQKLTIKHLQELRNMNDPKEIIFYCVEQLSKSRKRRVIRDGVIIKRISRKNRRTKSKEHYQGIINYLASGNKLEPSNKDTK